MKHFWKIQYNIQNYDNIFSSLKEHMFSRKLFQQIHNNRIDLHTRKTDFFQLLKNIGKNDKNDENSQIKNSKYHKKKDIKQNDFLLNFSKDLDDTYFWLFIFLKKKSEYDFQDILFKSQDLENYQLEKNELVDELRYMKQQKQIKKLKSKIKDLPETLMNGNLDLISFIKLIEIYRINVFIFWKGKRFYYEMLNNEDNEENKKELYIKNNCFVIELEEKDIKLIENNEIKKRYIDDKILDYYRIENIEKPLYAIGKYKVDELKIIYKKLFNKDLINDKKKMKKQELYDLVFQYF